MSLTDEQQAQISADVEGWPDPPASTLNYVALLFSSTRDQQAA